MSESYTYQFTNLNGGVFNSLDWGGSGPVALIGHSIGFCAGIYTPLAALLTDHFQVLGLTAGDTGGPRHPLILKNLKTGIFFMTTWRIFAGTSADPSLPLAILWVAL